MELHAAIQTNAPPEIQTEGNKDDNKKIAAGKKGGKVCPWGGVVAGVYGLVLEVRMLGNKMLMEKEYKGGDIAEASEHEGALIAPEAGENSSNDGADGPAYIIEEKKTTLLLAEFFFPKKRGEKEGEADIEKNYGGGTGDVECGDVPYGCHKTHAKHSQR